jgi:hypothetical protein
VVAALATHYDPVDAGEAEFLDGTEKRLDAQETDGGPHLAKISNPGGVPLVLYAHPEPCVRRKTHARTDFDEALGSLGEDLELMVRRPTNDVEDSQDEFGGDFVVEQVGHAVHEDPPACSPAERKFERFGH